MTRLDIIVKQLEEKSCGGTVRILDMYGSFSLGYRYHDLGGTDYQSLYEITPEEAIYCYKILGVNDVFGRVGKLIKDK